MTLDNIIARAGGLTKLAKIAGVDPSTIATAWRRTGKVPVVRARAVSEGLDIPLHELRPDVWVRPFTAEERAALLHEALTIAERRLVVERRDPACKDSLR